MKQVPITFDWSLCQERALELFLHNSGLARPDKRFVRMRGEAMALRPSIEAMADLRASVYYYEDVTVEGETATIGGQTFHCKAFAQMEGVSIQGAWVYMVSAGSFLCEDRPLMEQLYSDLWGTAFADAARDAMEETLEKTARLSDHFGPGFFGMPMEEMHLIKALVDCESMGVTIYETGVISPLKSCGGILFAVDESYQPLQAACRACYGNYLNCRLCQHGSSGKQ